MQRENPYAAEAQELHAAIPPLFPVEPVPDWLFTYKGPLENDDVGDVDYVGTHRVFSGRRWTEIGYQELCAYRGGPVYSSFGFLENPVAFRYYLPAWLRLATGDIEDLDALLSVCDSADKSQVSPKSHDFFTERFVPLLPTQKELMARIMRYGMKILPPFFAQDPATPAYWSYWRQFDPDPLPCPPHE